MYAVGLELPARALEGRVPIGEGDVLVDALRLAGIPAVSRLVVSGSALEAAFVVGMRETMEEYSDHVPIVHISAHGSDDGIGLTDGTLVSWRNLREMLKPINAALDGNLLLCMSACHGAAACRMAMVR